jgi:arylsulfatase A-like enzyme
VNLWHYAVHGPWGHKEEYTKEFAKKEDPTGRQGNPIMASMLRSVDESLGRVLAKLDELGLADNTIVIFYSDNGGNVVSNTGEKLREMESRKLSPAFEDMLADWKKWVGDQPPTNNAPLREGKGSLYEGGSRVPLMIRWPGKIPAGTTTEAIVHAYDLYPTLLDVLGIAQAGAADHGRHQLRARSPRSRGRAPRTPHHHRRAERLQHPFGRLEALSRLQEARLRTLQPQGRSRRNHRPDRQYPDKAKNSKPCSWTTSPPPLASHAF